MIYHVNANVLGYTVGDEFEVDDDDPSVRNGTIDAYVEGGHISPVEKPKARSRKES